MNFILVIGNFLQGIILTLLVALFNLLTAVHFPYALGFSIILLTIAIRLILWPFTASQYHLSQKQKRLAPHLSKIKEMHKGDQKRIQEETMKLYKEHGINPAAGCLPAIIQFPILIVLYNILRQIVSLKPAALIKYVNSSVFIPSFKIHTAWDAHFFGIPLGQSPSQLLKTFSVLIVLVPIVTAALQYVQSRMIFPQTPKEEKNDKKEKSTSDEFAQAMQTQSLYMFPLMIGIFSFTLPIGLSLYWNTISLFGILQQRKILKEYETGEILKK